MTNETEIMQANIKEMLESFDTVKKSNGEIIIILKVNSPEWVRDIVHKAHGDKLPDDWIYTWVYHTVDYIHGAYLDNVEEMEDLIPEIVDYLIDIYTSELTRWLHSRPDRICYIDEVEGRGEMNGFDLLQAAQAVEIDEVVNIVIHELIDKIRDDISELMEE